MMAQRTSVWIPQGAHVEESPLGYYLKPGRLGYFLEEPVSCSD